MRTVEFGSLFQFMRNGMSIKQDKSGEGLPISRIETIADSSIDPDRVGYAGLTFDACKAWLLQEGDILFSHINSVEHIGKCAVYRGVPVGMYTLRAARATARGREKATSRRLANQANRQRTAIRNNKNPGC